MLYDHLSLLRAGVPKLCCGKVAEFRQSHEIPVPGYRCNQKETAIHKLLSAFPAVFFVGHLLMKIHITKVVYNFGYRSDPPTRKQQGGIAIARSASG
jgi:hypothetical protein